MSFDPFWIKLLASFLVGGFYIGFVVVRSSEKFGSVFGGILAGMPSTVLISLIFIAWTQDTMAMWKAIPIIPFGLSVSVIFLMFLVVFYKRSKFISFFGSLGIWLAILMPFVLKRVSDMWLLLGLAAIVLSVCITILKRFPGQKPPQLAPGRKESWFRFAVAGGIIALAVFLGKAAGPLWGGLIASFPAATFSGIMLLINKHGSDFTISFVKGTAYGIVSNIGFLVLLYLLVPLWGIWAIFPALTLPVAFGLYKFLSLSR